MKKDVRKIMLESKFRTLHFSALARGDEKKAQEWLDEIEKLKN